MKKVTGIAILGLAIVLGGCSTNPTKEQIGTVTGAVVGGIVGSSVTGGALPERWAAPRPGPTWATRSASA